MRLPVIHGLIERRILINYRVNPAAIERILPPAFRPQLVAGHAIAGICLIRLSQVRPRGVPAALGIGSENAAHRIAVEWDDRGERRVGVYIPRRDTSSRLNVLVGGRVFPGEHHHAAFTVHESGGRFDVSMLSDDARTRVSIRAKVAEALPNTSLFDHLSAASDFFRQGSLGYSATSDANRYDGLELRCDQWTVRPLDVESVSSSFFDDPALFSPDQSTFDCALVMTNIRHQWRGQPDLSCPDRDPIAAARA